jgi:hypothetical protein
MNHSFIYYSKIEQLSKSKMFQDTILPNGPFIFVAREKKCPLEKGNEVQCSLSSYNLCLSYLNMVCTVCSLWLAGVQLLVIEKVTELTYWVRLEFTIYGETFKPNLKYIRVAMAKVNNVNPYLAYLTLNFIFHFCPSPLVQILNLINQCENFR